MPQIVGVKFKSAGKVYYFDPAGIELEKDDQVVVETARGQELGEVTIPPREAEENEIEKPLKPVIRQATPEDIERNEKSAEKEAEALAECTELVHKLNLPMKLLSAEYNIDGSRLTVYFSAAERVDFRELVRELARKLKTRVEMRQTGPRDEARLVGGCGRCGRQLCCTSFLSEFAPVAMRMAKDQGLPLNPMKISGCCGRLMCCLVYENQQYRDMRAKLPRNGQTVFTAAGEGRVVGSNPLKETVMVELESEATAELPLAEVSLEPRPREPQREQPAEQHNEQPREQSREQSGERFRGRPRGRQRRRS